MSTRGLSPGISPLPQNSLDYPLESACVAQKQKTKLCFEPGCLYQKQSPSVPVGIALTVLAALERTQDVKCSPQECGVPSVCVSFVGVFQSGFGV